MLDGVSTFARFLGGCVALYEVSLCGCVAGRRCLEALSKLEDRFDECLFGFRRDTAVFINDSRCLEVRSVSRGWRCSLCLHHGGASQTRRIERATFARSIRKASTLLSWFPTHEHLKLVCIAYEHVGGW